LLPSLLPFPGNLVSGVSDVSDSVSVFDFDELVALTAETRLTGGRSNSKLHSVSIRLTTEAGLVSTTSKYIFSPH